MDAVDVVSPNSVDDVTNGKWPLTLFTCTLDAQNRVVVRCKQGVESILSPFTSFYIGIVLYLS